LTAALLAVAGCATTPTVRYGDAGAQTPLSTDFGSSDLQQVAGAMADSLLAFPSVAEVTARRRPVITVDRVKNKTMQHIDTEAITDSIRTRLIRSGKFRFIDRTTDAATVDEIRTQQEGGLVDRKKAVEFGGQEGAEYLLTANLAEIRQANDDVTDVYYKFTMSLKNLRTGILEWSDEKEIRKISTRPYVGS
jgi:uncharacterized protein (TIGR02722 family)